MSTARKSHLKKGVFLTSVHVKGVEGGPRTSARAWVRVRGSGRCLQSPAEERVISGFE